MLNDIVTSTWEWMSPEWFLPNTLLSFEWENELYAYLALATPLVFVLRWLIHLRLRQKVEVAFSEEQMQSSRVKWLRFVPSLILLQAMICIMVALARPQRTNEEIIQTSEGIDILLTLDISESMLIEDFTPNRLEAAKLVAKNFVHGRKYDRIGLVIFSGEAYSVSPLTTDYKLLKRYIEDIREDMIQENGTAIGSALGMGTIRMQESASRSKVVILISDGDNTAGNLDPITASRLATAHNIKIYTILVGRSGKVPYGRDMFGQPQYVNNTVDESVLREIAKIGEGKFYRASDNQALKNVFAEINRLEKTEIIENRFKSIKDYYYVYLTWGLIFIVLWLALKSSFMSNVLED
ncbi:VWA domain-containing protein [Microscilla marina]|uniref:von Willebrand factor type A domain protein n=1 Tax=Microscilla marina ATCC 23134 TaxID=313606 RepID=A1ZQV4_MICM2|nr:VWA domain-containing protein [Microscilla marina]EAY27259.1 von Willebrand factor type A domain protein [Microscilla marina ATCC 23134]